MRLAYCFEISWIYSISHGLQLIRFDPQMAMICSLFTGIGCRRDGFAPRLMSLGFIRNILGKICEGRDALWRLCRLKGLRNRSGRFLLFNLRSFGWIYLDFNLVLVRFLLNPNFQKFIQICFCCLRNQSLKHYLL